jgi:hypothetical protein
MGDAGGRPAWAPVGLRGDGHHWPRTGEMHWSGTGFTQIDMPIKVRPRAVLAHDAARDWRRPALVYLQEEGSQGVRGRVKKKRRQAWETSSAENPHCPHAKGASRLR